MNISGMLADQPPRGASGRSIRDQQTRPPHPYPTRHGGSFHTQPEQTSYSNIPPPRPMYYAQAGFNQGATQHNYSASTNTETKTVHFRLLLDNYNRDRLPIRVSIHRHDTVESIVSMVKSFWGLYDGQGVSFENLQGNVIIAQYENLHHNETCNVKVFHEQPAVPGGGYQYGAQRSQQSPTPHLGEPFRMPPPHQQLSRPASRSTRRREASPPAGPGHRSGSNRPSHKIRTADGDNSDSDEGSVSSSRRAKSEQVHAEISLDNIVAGGRRQLAKFDSSELPLFAPPQQPVPASMSSMSPQRRYTNGNVHSPINMNPQTTFHYDRLPVPYSPQTYSYNGLATPNTGSMASGYVTAPYQANSHHMRTSSTRVPLRSSAFGGSNMLPTPDPTINSVISDEDVALQLMRLGGDRSNQSHGRTSTSTVDDAVSGKAEMASSAGATDDEREGEELPLPKNQQSHAAGPSRKKLKESNALTLSYGDYTSEEEYDDRKDSSFKGDSDPLGMENTAANHNKSKPKSTKAKSRTNSVTSKGRSSKLKSKSGSTTIPPSPYSAGTQSRKGSNASAAVVQQAGNAGEDDDDLSTKPRCQRCRKSKKGCDRQRPCQRCKDAGIGTEGCISEDEGNGRKGRFGRHMGVPAVIVKGAASNDSTPTHNHSFASEAATIYPGDATIANAEASKKRKR